MTATTAGLAAACSPTRPASVVSSHKPASRYALRRSGLVTTSLGTATAPPLVLLAELVQPLGVARQDQLAIVGGDTRHRRLDRTPRVGPVGADVRVVVGPQHPLGADPLQRPKTEGVGHVAVVEVALDVLARQRLQPEL